MEFNEFRVAVSSQFEKMVNEDKELFVVDVCPRELYEFYLDAFPEGTNQIFKEQREYDCFCCKQFIKNGANIVSIKDNKLVSIWDIDLPEHYYKEVAAKLSEFIKSKPIKDLFRSSENELGKKNTVQILEDKTINWNHFHIKIPNKFVMVGDDIGTFIGRSHSDFDVLKRSLEELTLDAAETILELIDSNSLYRGDEHTSAITGFISTKRVYDSLCTSEKDNYVWKESSVIGSRGRIRNTAIGTLLVNLSGGMEIDRAVRAFESVVAPHNYKRPKALVTRKMVENAHERVKELGLESSLDRRFAVASDLTVNNILFVDNDTKPAMNIFEELAEQSQDTVKESSKLEEVSISDFVTNILPHTTSLELLLKNSHNNNLMSLIAPKDPESKNMFKWDNNFSWTYNGEVTDSIKERVKKAGGNVTGEFRCSLSWFNYDDLDIHLKEPSGNIISYSSKSNRLTGGTLDVDMNAGGSGSREAVENITYPQRSRMQEGRYELIVHNFTKRERKDEGFDIEMDYLGTVWGFSYPRSVSNNEKVVVAIFEYSHSDGIKIIKSLPENSTSKDIWGVRTESFNKVSMLLKSPNHWDGNETGNKHWFFILDKCNSGTSGRGFFNEFLKEDLREHRKVFEVLGSKLRAEESEEQLSGIGFSSTKRDSVCLRVSGKYQRLIKVNF